MSEKRQLKDTIVVSYIEYALTLESLGLEKTEFEQAMSYVKEKQAACSVLVAPGFHNLR